MPFLGRDWRSDGEKWIKTDQGWERTKVIECILDHINAELKNDTSKHLRPNSVGDDDVDDDDDEDKSVYNYEACEHKHTRKPFIMLQNASNREIAPTKPSISEILNGLDMVGAVRDIRRFNYVAKIVKIIINDKLTQISGNAQRTLFIIVKVMLFQVIKTKENMNIMKNLLNDFKKKLQNSYYYYFYYIGSQQLWERHVSEVSKWQHLLEHESNLVKKNLTSDFSLINIPNDCKMEILRRLNNGLDLVNLAKCNKAFNSIVTKELSIWKSLCVYHYQQSNINQILNKTQPKKDMNEMPSEQQLDWKSLYFRLKRRYGHKEVYVDMIHKCIMCKGLFWKEIGHDCIHASETGEEVQSEPITPNKLINILLV